MSSLFFRIKDSASSYSVVELFLRAWIDANCNNEVNYIVDDPTSNDFFRVDLSTLNVRVDFDNTEDAILLKLKGVPEELSVYVELLDHPLPDDH